MGARVKTLQGEMTAHEIFSKLAADARRNFKFGILGGAFVYWLAGVWRLGAQGLFWFSALVVGLDTLQVAFIVATGAISEVGILIGAADREAREGEKWLVAGTVVRILSAAISIGILYVLYRRIW